MLATKCPTCGRRIRQRIRQRTWLKTWRTMRQKMSGRWTSPVAVSVMGHVAIAGILVLAQAYFGHQPEPRRELVEMEIVQPRDLPEPEIAKLPPPPEPPPAPAAEAPPPEPAPEVKPRPARIAKARPRPQPAPATAANADAEPAPGAAINQDAMAKKRVFRLPASGPGGAIPIARGTTSGSARGARGQAGTNTGGGGTRPGGTGVKGPVSIAAIKRPARPVGNHDYIGGYRDYPSEARKRKVEGPVKVELLVDDEGRVASASLVTRLGHGLDQRALHLARKLRFRPAIDTADRPVASIVIWTFRFRIPS